MGELLRSDAAAALTVADSSSVDLPWLGAMKAFESIRALSNAAMAASAAVKTGGSI